MNDRTKLKIIAAANVASAGASNSLISDGIYDGFIEGADFGIRLGEKIGIMRVINSLKPGGFDLAMSIKRKFIDEDEE